MVGLQKQLLKQLHKMLLDVGPYAPAYKHMHETLLEQEARGEPPKVALRFSSGAPPDPRRYNEPTSRDIAIVYTGLHPPPPSNRYATVYARSDDGCGDTRPLSILNEHIDPMTYALLFPCGEKGWCPDLKISPNSGYRWTRRDRCSWQKARTLNKGAGS